MKRVFVLAVFLLFPIIPFHSVLGSSFFRISITGEEETINYNL